MHIYITTSNGVYKYSTREKKTQKIIDNKYAGFFHRKAKGFFGITQGRNSNEIIIASREKLGTPNAGKPATDCRLLSLDANTNNYHIIGEVLDVHDVHQIAAYQQLIFLTDTGKNRVVVFDREKKKVVHWLNLGLDRKDIHHINAILIFHEKLFIGLNNRGESDSQILEIQLKEVIDSCNSEGIPDLLNYGKLHTLKNRHHTHDLLPFENSFLVCGSHEGIIFRADSGQILTQQNRWVRGIAQTDEGLWVGSSPIAERSERHSEKLNGTLLLFTLPAFEKQYEVSLEGAAQVNDMIAVKLRES